MQQLAKSAEPGRCTIIPLGRSAHFWKIDAKGIHVEPVEEAGKVLAEARQALVHELEVHHVGLEIGDGISELGERGLECVQGETVRAAVCAALGRLAKRRARRGS